jgi:hypothetical protein
MEDALLLRPDGYLQLSSHGWVLNFSFPMQIFACLVPYVVCTTLKNLQVAPLLALIFAGPNP